MNCLQGPVRPFKYDEVVLKYKISSAALSLDTQYIKLVRPVQMKIYEKKINEETTYYCDLFIWGYDKTKHVSSSQFYGIGTEVREASKEAVLKTGCKLNDDIYYTLTEYVEEITKQLGYITYIVD